MQKGSIGFPLFNSSNKTAITLIRRHKGVNNCNFGQLKGNNYAINHQNMIRKLKGAYEKVLSTSLFNSNENPITQNKM